MKGVLGNHKIFILISTLFLFNSVYFANAWAGAERPGTPSISAPSTSTTGSFTVSWGSIYAATQYKIVQSGSSSANYSTASTSLNINGLADGSYDFKVQACSSNFRMFSYECSYYSNTVTVTVQRPPGIPGDINIPGTISGNYSISWGAAGGTIERYEVREHFNGNWGGWSNNGTSLSKSFSGKSDGSYLYQVRACNSVAGCSSEKQSGSFTVLNLPGQPGAITVPSSTTQGNYTISWTASTGSVERYEYLERYNGVYGAWISNGTSNSVSFSAKPDGDYLYQVRAVNAMGNSQVRWSASFSVLNPPSAPGGITVPSSTTGSYTVSWGTASGVISNYYYRESANGGSSYGAWIDNGTSTSKSFSGKADGSYVYQVYAANASGSSSAVTSNVISVINVPGVAPGVTANFNGTNITVSWDSASGQVERYEWQQIYNSNAGGWSSNGTSQNINISVSSSGQYQYNIKACNSAGCGTVTGSSTVTVNLAPAVTINAGTPYDLDGVINVQWSTQGMDLSQIARFEVERNFRPDGGTWNGWYYGGSIDVINQSGVYRVDGHAPGFGSLNQSGLADGSWLFRLRYYGHDNSQSAPGPQSSQAEVFSLPSAPSNINVPSTTGGNFSVSWGDAGGSIDYYEIAESNNGGISYGLWENTGLLKYSDRLNKHDGYYQYQARACNSMGCGPAATSAMVTVYNPPTISLISDAQTPYETNGGHTLSWNTTGLDLSEVDFFQVHRRHQPLNGNMGGWTFVAEHQVQSANNLYTQGQSGLADGVWEYKLETCASTGCADGPVLSVPVRVTPGIPSGVIASQQAEYHEDVNVAWSNSSGSVTHYRLERRERSNSSQPWSAWVSSLQTPVSNIYSPALNIQQLGLSDGLYQYRVQACNEGGCSGWSNSSNEVEVVHLPAGVSSVSVNTGSAPNQIYLSWSLPNNEVLQIRFERWHEGVMQDSQLLAPTSQSPTHYLSYGNYSFKLTTINRRGTGPTVTVDHQLNATVGTNNNPWDDSDHIGLPEDIGEMSGDLSVGSTGALNYSVSIDVPPGLNGMQPNLSVNYNNQAGNGDLGQGFSLSASSNIARCGKTHLQDGTVDGVLNNDDFRFCLDGQRLVKVAANEYRTESESYNKIVASDGSVTPLSWTVFHSDGRQSHYGSSAEARQSHNGLPYRWWLSDQHDVNNNHVYYNYHNDSNTGEHRLTQITYGENVAAAVNLNHRVELVYEDRPDTWVGFFAAAKQARLKRLNRVDVYAGGETAASRSYHFDYQYEANPAVNPDPTKISRIENIRVCYAGGQCQSTEFTWSSLGDYMGGFIEDNTWIKGEHYAAQAQQLVDVDLDGISDRVTYYTSSINGSANNYVGSFEVELGLKSGGYASPQTRIPSADNPLNVRISQLTDINGDGFPDAIAMQPNMSTLLNPGDFYYNVSGIFVAYNDGSGNFGAVESWNGYPVDAPDAQPDHWPAIVLQDMNSDGLADVVRRPLFLERIACHPVHCVSFTGSEFFLKLQLKSEGGGYGNQAYASPMNPGEETYYDKMGDLNGDGLIDLLGVHLNQTVQVMMQNDDATVFDSPQTWTNLNMPSNQNCNRHTGDVNGDGLTDLILACQNDGVKIWLSNGEGFIDSGIWLNDHVAFDPSDNPYLASNNLYFTLIDLNQDGLNDILAIDNVVQGSSAVVKVAFGTGSGFSDLITWANLNSTVSRSLSDVNGDGFIDLVLDDQPAEAISGQTYLNPLNPMRIERITTGPISKDIYYTTLADENVYSTTNGNSIGSHYRYDHQAQQAVGSSPTGMGSNQFTFSAPIQKSVVKQIDRPDGIGGINSTLYKYQDLKTDRLYGSLGFARKTVILPSGIQVETTYSQDAEHHLVGQVIQKRRLKPTGEPLQETFQQWAERTFNDDIDGDGSPHYVSYIQNKLSKHYDLITGALTHRVYVTKDPAGQTTCDAVSETVLSHASEAVSTFDDDGNLKSERTVVCDDINNETHTSETVYPAYDRRETANLYVTGLILSENTSKQSNAGVELIRHTDYSYDAQGRLQTQTQAPDATDAKVVTSYTYDSTGAVSSTSESWDSSQPGLLDANGNPQHSRTTTITASYSGALKTIITQNPLHTVAQPQAVEEHYDAWGRLIQSIDLLGTVTITTYDAYGRPVQQTATQGGESLNTYTGYKLCNNSCTNVPNAYSLLHVKADGKGPSRVYYDNKGREVGARAQNAQGDHVYTLKSYDHLGRVSTERNPHRPLYNEGGGLTQYQYDILDRVTQKILPSGLIISLDHQNLKLMHHDSQRGFVQEKQSNALGQLRYVIDALNTRTDYDYDAFGNLSDTAVSDGSTTINTHIDYHRYGARERLLDPSTGEQVFTNHPLGMVISSRDAMYQLTYNSYDLLGRLLNQTDYETSGNIIQTGSWVYNHKGQLSHQSGNDTEGRDTSSTMTYNAWGQLATRSSEISGVVYTHEWQYDRYQRPQTHLYPMVESDRLVINQYYNDFGALAQITDSQGVAYWTLTEADSAWGTTGATLGNGLSTETIYESRRGLVTFQGVGINGAYEIQDTVYDYDSLGNLEVRNDGHHGSNEFFCYDNLNRLTHVGNNGVCGAVDYGYDAFGNLIQKDSSGQNQFYGENGNSLYALSRVDKGNGVQHDYFYNAKGELTMVKEGSATQQGQTWTNFGKPRLHTRYDQQAGTVRASNIIYGADKNRIERQDFEGSDWKRVVYYVGDYEQVVHADGRVQHRHNIGGLAVITFEPGQASRTDYLHKDTLGSLYAQTQQGAVDMQTSSLVEDQYEHFRFDPWGNRINLDGSALTDPLAFRNETTDRGFTGHEHLDDVNIIHMNGRVYSPETGRFLSPDPLVQAPEYSQSFNRYSYAWNNPLNIIDPSGYGNVDTAPAPASDTSAGNHAGTDHGGGDGDGDGDDNQTFSDLIKSKGYEIGQIIVHKGQLYVVGPKGYKPEAIFKTKVIDKKPKLGSAGEEGANGNSTTSDQANNATANSSTSPATNNYSPENPATPPVGSVIDVDAATKYLTDNAANTSTGLCARHVRFALMAGGAEGLANNERSPDLEFARNYGDYLQDQGWYAFDMEGYVPMKGDIAVFDAYTGQNPQAGHIQMYNGEQWVSDFKQNYFKPNVNATSHVLYRQLYQ